MNLSKVLLFYKKSAYKVYFQEKQSSFRIKNKELVKKEVERFRQAHIEHYATLECVEEVLARHNVNFKKSFRGQSINYDKYDLVITVGGDGTFLEAARSIKNSAILGVNSSLSYSVGNFCVASKNNFELIIKKILQKGFKTRGHQRLRVDIDNMPRKIDCLNDILVSHNNPAAMNRYIIKVGRIKEEQRSSGVWVSTPSGSSGAIRSAGGRRMALAAKKFQYRPRELYWGGQWHYRLTGGILSGRQIMTVTSLMRKGKIYIDGTHLEVPFPFGATVKVRLSPNPIRTIDP